MKRVEFSETIAASDLKVSRCRHIIEFIKVCEYRRSRVFLDLEGQGYFLTLTLAQGRVHTKFKSDFLRTYCGNLNQKYL